MHQDIWHPQIPNVSILLRFLSLSSSAGKNLARKCFEKRGSGRSRAATARAGGRSMPARSGAALVFGTAQLRPGHPRTVPRSGSPSADDPGRLLRGPYSGQDRLDDLGGDVGEPEVAALEAIDQPMVVDAEEGEDRRMQVVDVDDVVHGGVAELVGGAMGHAALDAAAGHPDREALDVVVAA